MKWTQYSRTKIIREIKPRTTLQKLYCVSPEESTYQVQTQSQEEELVFTDYTEIFKKVLAIIKIHTR